MSSTKRPTQLYCRNKCTRSNGNRPPKPKHGGLYGTVPLCKNCLIKNDVFTTNYMSVLRSREPGADKNRLEQIFHASGNPELCTKAALNIHCMVEASKLTFGTVFKPDSYYYYKEEGKQKSRKEDSRKKKQRNRNYRQSPKGIANYQLRQITRDNKQEYQQQLQIYGHAYLAKRCAVNNNIRAVKHHNSHTMVKRAQECDELFRDCKGNLDELLQRIFSLKRQELDGMSILDLLALGYGIYTWSTSQALDDDRAKKEGYNTITREDYAYVDGATPLTGTWLDANDTLCFFAHESVNKKAILAIETGSHILLRHYPIGGSGGSGGSRLSVRINVTKPNQYDDGKLCKFGVTLITPQAMNKLQFNLSQHAKNINKGRNPDLELHKLSIENCTMDFLVDETNSSDMKRVLEAQELAKEAMSDPNSFKRKTITGAMDQFIKRTAPSATASLSSAGTSSSKEEAQPSKKKKRIQPKLSFAASAPSATASLSSAETSSAGEEEPPSKKKKREVIIIDISDEE